jgi:hypothetical protein
VSPLDGVNGVRNLLARIGLAVGRVSGAGGRSGSAAPSLSTHNSPLAVSVKHGPLFEPCPASAHPSANTPGWCIAASPFATDVAVGNPVQIDRNSLSDPITLLDLDGPVIDTR